MKMTKVEFPHDLSKEDILEEDEEIVKEKDEVIADVDNKLKIC
jgi:hypothetical protein